VRIACVQNGDYTRAYQTLVGGAAENYNGQRYTVEAFVHFVRDLPSVVISLDSSAHAEMQGQDIRMSLGEPRHRRWLPQRISLKRYARRVIEKLETLGTTHLLVRCVDIVGCELLEWANTRRIPAAAIVAARFNPAHEPARRFCELANNPNVLFVANHNRVATETCIECGLAKEKAIAWDLPPATTPDLNHIRSRDSADPLRILTAGTVQEAKGITDLLEACVIARNRDIDARLTICGDGPLLDQLRTHPGVTQGWLECPGQIAHGEVLARMSGADIVAVPSRFEFAEGLPFVIHEALSLRLPLLLSNHPVFVRYFTDRTGVRFFEAGNAAACAAVVTELADDPQEYSTLSNDTATVWSSLQCETKFHHLLERLRAEWRLDKAAESRPRVEVQTFAKPRPAVSSS
jgi:glycosyltransferase involved in cell wall biosynthesis